MDDLLPLPSGAPGRPKNNRYREQYGLIVICGDEAEQRTVYEALQILRTVPIKVVVT